MNAYQVLEITEGSSKKVVKQAYRKLAGLLHPDRNQDPQAADRFKLVKEAYEFLTTGRSATSKFGKPPPKPKPAPRAPDYSPPVHPYGVPRVDLQISIAEVFTGCRRRITHTPYFIWIPAGAKNGHQRRMVAQSEEGARAYFDVVTWLCDPREFFFLRNVDARQVLSCRVQVTIIQLLANAEIVVRNPNPNVSDLTVTTSVSDLKYENLIPVPNGGLPHSRGRDLLYVELDVLYKPLHAEIYPHLKELKDQLDTVLSNYKHFR